MDFLLKAEPRGSLEEKVVDEVEIGELNLIVDHNLELIDENWFIDVDSPWVVARTESSTKSAHKVVGCVGNAPKWFSGPLYFLNKKGMARSPSP